MLGSLHTWPLLSGHRGRPVVNVDLLVETLMRFSYLIAHLPEICEVDINPLLATPGEVIALDARVLVDRSVQPSTRQPNAHLAICPYPRGIYGSGEPGGCYDRVPARRSAPKTSRPGRI